jgi:succinyl-CoA synthetase alpha subunit
MKFTSPAALGFAALGLAAAAMTAPALADDTATTAATTTAAAFSTDTAIEALMADERAKAVVTKHIPGLDQHPAYEQFKTLSLKALAPFSQGLISDELLGKIETDLAAIK